MRISLLVLGTIIVSACARPDYVESFQNRAQVSGGAQAGYAIKQVLEKRKPETLVAEGGSVCRTSVRRFAATHSGAWIACDWKPGAE